MMKPLHLLTEDRRRTSLLVWCLLASVACACNIPVFRYALERWRPDPCQIVVLYDKELTKEQQRFVESLAPTSEKTANHANVELVLADINDTSLPLVATWRSMPDSDRGLPHVFVRTKLGPDRWINGWHGSLESMSGDRVLESPARKELARRLLAGHAVVWILVTSEDQQKNDAAKKLLADNLEPLSSKIELPEGIGLPGSELHSEIPLLLKFSSLQIDPQDEKEAFLVNLFAGFQPEAVKDGEPLLIPVFGRGRALEVIPASEMTPKLMEDLTGFLSGACSCQVKEQNPGFDLLLSVDWNTKLFGAGQAPPPERTERDRQKPILLTIPPGNRP